MSAQEEATRLFSEHAGRLRWYVRSRGADQHVADDLVQVCFLALLRAWERTQHKHPENPQAYLYRVAYNQTVDLYRQSAVEPLGDTDQKQEDHAHHSDRRLDLTRAVQELSGRKLEVVQLVLVEGLSYGEIAEILGIAESTVRVHIYQARKILRPRLAGYGP